MLWASGQTAFDFMDLAEPFPLRGFPCPLVATVSARRTAYRYGVSLSLHVRLVSIRIDVVLAATRPSVDRTAVRRAIRPVHTGRPVTVAAARRATTTAGVATGVAIENVVVARGPAVTVRRL